MTNWFFLSSCVGRARENSQKLKFFIFASRDERENMPWVLGKWKTFYEKLEASKNIQSVARSAGLVRLRIHRKKRRSEFSYFVSGVRVAREWFVYLSYCVAWERECASFWAAHASWRIQTLYDCFRRPVQFSLLRKFSLCRSAANYCIQIRGYFAVMQLERLCFVRRTIAYDPIDSCNRI